MTLNEIRKDLREIRYYYGRRETFKIADADIGSISLKEKIAKYNEAVREAPPKLYDVYYNLYIKNNTQESLSYELSYTPEYVQMLNKKLLKFLQEKLTA